MAVSKECLQLTEHGPTPCFTEAGGQRCDLDVCPAWEYFRAHPEEDGFKILNHHCVITHPYDYQGTLRSIQIALIAKNKK